MINRPDCRGDDRELLHIRPVTEPSSAMDKDISPPPLKRRRVTANTDDQLLNKSPRIVRLFSWNVNGIAPFIQRPITSFFTSDRDDQSRSQASLRNFLKRHGFPTLLFLQEIKINPSDRATLDAITRAIKRAASEPVDHPDYVAHFCLPTDKHNATGFGRKVYGVCSVVRQDFHDKYTECMRTVNWDAEGRISVIETKPGLDIPRLAILNVYMVNGTENPYKDSTTGAVSGTRHMRKLAFHRLLQAEVRRLEHRGCHVIVAGDINIAVSAIDGHPNLRTFPQQHVLNRQDFIRRFLCDDGTERRTGDDKRTDYSESAHDCLDMVDTFRSLHPDERGYSYYPHGRTFGESCDRVDMVLCSRSLIASCVEAGMLATAADRGTSDHVPIFATFDMNIKEDKHVSDLDVEHS